MTERDGQGVIERGGIFVEVAAQVCLKCWDEKSWLGVSAAFFAVIGALWHGEPLLVSPRAAFGQAAHLDTGCFFDLRFNAWGGLSHDEDDVSSCADQLLGLRLRLCFRDRLCLAFARGATHLQPPLECFGRCLHLLRADFPCADQDSDFAAVGLVTRDESSAECAFVIFEAQPVDVWDLWRLCGAFQADKAHFRCRACGLNDGVGVAGADDDLLRFAQGLQRLKAVGLF